MRLGSARGLLPCYHPALRQQHKALGDVAPLARSRQPGPRLRQCPFKRAAGIGVVDKDAAQPGKGPADLSQQAQRLVAVLHVGGANNGAREQAERIDEIFRLRSVLVF